MEESETSRQFVTNIAGRVKKVQAKNYLLAMYEALTNAIQSHELSNENKEIQIHIVRDASQQELEAGQERPISSIKIKDCGAGFNEENMTSFCQTDSAFKEKIGGKGVGRFAWLKFFDQVYVESVFKNSAGQTFQKTFTFDKNGISHEKNELYNGAPETSITLNNLNSKYISQARKSIDDICELTVEHFISYFATDGMPTIVVKDGIKTKSLNDLYDNSIGQTKVSGEIKIKDKLFNLTGIKFYHGNEAHSIHLCANKRASEKVALGSYNSFLGNKFSDSNLGKYAFQVYVESEYLNDIVNEDREGFRFPDENSFDLYDGGITKKEIIEAVMPFVLKHLSLKIEEKKNENLNNVKTFISTVAPQYKYLISKKADEIVKINKTEPADVDLELRKLQFEYENQTREEANEIIKTIATSANIDKSIIEKRIGELLSKLNDTGKANLSQYILQRKLILEILKQRLQVVDQVRAKEEAVHSLIFPMQTESTEVTYEQQNLWIIDERLSYHHYLASDKPLSANPNETIASGKEPDIIVFNRPIALNDREATSGKFESIVIVEFKRPGDITLTNQRNPYSQVVEYITKIRENRARSYSGNAIEVSTTTNFYCYIVCDLPEDVKSFFQTQYDMKLTPDGRGLYKFHDTLNAYIEVISYNKMLDDAGKRNRILFNKLNIS